MTKGFASLRVAVALAALVLCGASTSVAQVSDAAKKTGNAITDSWITMKVHSQFIPEDALEGSDIDVDTSAGVVALKGTVPTEAAKTRAVAIAKATDGVKSVTDQLRIVKPAATGTAGTAGKAVTDGWIKSKIYSQYLTEDALDDSDLDIDVSQGAVVLNGAVKTEAAKTRAESIAKATDGVKSVKNNLKINPSVK